jgi:hypothetical protein
MPWNWGSHGTANVGTMQEARTPGAWAQYEDDTLKHFMLHPEIDAELNALDGRGGAAKRQVFLSEKVRGYKEHADNCIKSEFSQWLAGTHPEYNRDTGVVYQNSRKGDLYKKPRRIQTMRDPEGRLTAGVDTMTDWRHTAWGNRSLAHLEGVGPWLRGEMEATRKKEMEMNILAEFGPHNLAQAWAYFKHWVKGRPVGMHCALDDELPDDGEEPLYFNRSQLKQMDSNYDSAPHETARQAVKAPETPVVKAPETPVVVGGKTWAERNASLLANAVSLASTPATLPPPSPRNSYMTPPTQTQGRLKAHEVRAAYDNLGTNSKGVVAEMDRLMMSDEEAAYDNLGTRSKGIVADMDRLMMSDEEAALSTRSKGVVAEMEQHYDQSGLASNYSPFEPDASSSADTPSAVRVLEEELGASLAEDDDAYSI